MSSEMSLVSHSWRKGACVFAQQTQSCNGATPFSVPGNNQCFYFNQWYRWRFSPCLGWLVLSQLLRVEVWVWQDLGVFLSEGNGPGNRWSKWTTVMTPKHKDTGAGGSLQVSGSTSFAHPSAEKCCFTVNKVGRRPTCGTRIFLLILFTCSALTLWLMATWERTRAAALGRQSHSQAHLWRRFECCIK